MYEKVVSILLIIFLSISTGSVTIQFSEMGLVSQELDIYYPNGTLFNSIITNASITLPDNNSFQVAIRPERINYLRDPGQAINLLLEYWEFIIIVTVIIFMVTVIAKK